MGGRVYYVNLEIGYCIYVFFEVIYLKDIKDLIYIDIMALWGGCVYER